MLLAALVMVSLEVGASLAWGQFQVEPVVLRQVVSHWALLAISWGSAAVGSPGSFHGRPGASIREPALSPGVTVQSSPSR